MVLTYGGQIIEETEITSLKSKLSKYNLETAQLIIQQGFAYLADNKNNEQINQHTSILLEKIILFNNFKQ